jgi:hypothetical protein
MGTPRSKPSGMMHTGSARWLVRWSSRFCPSDTPTVELHGRSMPTGVSKAGSRMQGFSLLNMCLGWMPSLLMALASVMA